MAKKHKRAQGTGSVYQRPGCNTWHIQYFVNGRRVRESTGMRTREEAADLLAIRLGAVAKGEPVQATRSIKVQALYDFLCQYNHDNGKRTETHRWAHLQPVFGNVAAVKVDTAMISSYRAQRTTAGAANATINRELSMLRHMFRIACYERTPALVAAVPHIKLTKENNVRKGFADATDYLKLQQAAEFTGELWLLTMLELGYRYGWRKGELVGLQVRQCNFNTGTITLDPGTTKNQEGREVAMLPRVRSLLERCCKGKRPEDEVLTRSCDRPVVDPRVAWWNLCVSTGLGHWECKRCKASSNRKGRCPCGAYQWRYRGLLVHDLRRSAVKGMMRAQGMNQHTAMAISGHKTASMFARYHIIDRAEHLAAAAKMEQAYRAEVAAARRAAKRASHKAATIPGAAAVATMQPQSKQVQ